METGVNVSLFQFEKSKLFQIQKHVFERLDVSESIRKDYNVRIKHFIHYTQIHGISINTYLEYKRFLGGIDTFSIATKNKYLKSASKKLGGLPGNTY